MSTSNYAYGNSMYKNLPAVSAGAGIQFPFGTVLPPGGRVIYLRSTGPQDGDDTSWSQRLETTLAAALSKCRSGLADTIIVLPGHSESVVDATMLDNLVDGTRIIGAGSPMQDDAPQFRWTATASQWAVDNKNCVIANLLLRLEGANGVVKAINITGAGNSLVGNVIQTASGASNKATIAIEVGSGATNCVISQNYVHGTATHNSTDVIKVVGATVPSRLCVANNTMIASATAGNGLIHVTVAALQVLIQNNILYNTHTASTACVAVDAVAADGIIANNSLATINNGTASAQGIVQGAGSLFKSFQNFSCDEDVKSGVLAPAAVAT